jgi:Ca2+-binding RTX toxin-like protein
LTEFAALNPSADGTEGDDVLLGSKNDDTLTGSGGNDFLVSSGGNDYLDGGEGHDVYILGDTFGDGKNPGTVTITDRRAGRTHLLQVRANRSSDRRPTD